MARLARAVAPGVAHHVTQRGNRGMDTFLCPEDYTAYLDLVSEWCERWAVEVWAYCLMPNHVHLIAVPQCEDGLGRALGEAHRRYTRRVNSRQGWRGYLWQGRFASCPMDEDYCLCAARYIELNPVRAGLVSEPGAYLWSSASAHLSGKDDVLVKSRPLLDLAGDWAEFLDVWPTEEKAEELRRHSRTGRPLGTVDFMMGLEAKLHRRLRPRKPGPEAQAKRG